MECFNIYDMRYIEEEAGGPPDASEQIKRDFNAGAWQILRGNKFPCGCTNKIDRCVPGFTLRLKQGEDIFLTDGALDVTDDRAGCVVHEFNADLGDTSARASAAEHLRIIYEYKLPITRDFDDRSVMLKQTQ